jgi:GNAT superfamily N-acetyltransferase
MEQLDQQKMERFAQRLGCTFCDDGPFAEMSMTLQGYQEKTRPIAGITYGFYSGPVSEIRDAVRQVDTEWVQYFNEKTPIFCAFLEGKPISFCIVEEDENCPLAIPGIRVGSIGCVGTLPQHRGRQIGLRMVDLATVFLRDRGCHKGYISYTGIDHWYAKLGYKTYARFRFR